jgi:hypothetical protein
MNNLFGNYLAGHNEQKSFSGVKIKAFLDHIVPLMKLETYLLHSTLLVY